MPRSSRWRVLDEIERLDPARDHRRIVHLSFGYDFPWDSIRALEIALPVFLRREHVRPEARLLPRVRVPEDSAGS